MTEPVKDDTGQGDEEIKKEFEEEFKKEEEEKEEQKEEEKAETESTKSTKSEDTNKDVEETEEKDIEDTDSPDIPTRDHVSNIIARQKRTIEKLRSEKEQSQEDETEEIEETAIDRAVKKQMAPYVDHLSKQSDEAELRSFIEAEPDAKAYEKTIRAYMDHDNYRGVPPSVIYHHLAFEQAAKTGSKVKEAADLEAAQTSGAGSTSREVERPTGDIPTAEEMEDMSDEEFEKIRDKALQGKYVK